MCNCDDNKTNCYHINFGCVQPVVANADNYYTKSEVDDKIEDIATSGCCITPEEVDDKISAATSDYATKGELSAHTSNTDIHVTALDKAYWNGKVSVTQLSNYMLKSKIWCGTISEYNSIPTKDSETIYLIHN